MSELKRYMVPGGHGVEAHSAGLLYLKGDADEVIDDLRAQLAEAQAQAQTARYDALRDAAAEASYQASEENDYRPPMVDVTSAILALIQPTTDRRDAAMEE